MIDCIWNLKKTYFSRDKNKINLKFNHKRKLNLSETLICLYIVYIDLSYPFWSFYLVLLTSLGILIFNFFENTLPLTNDYIS